MAEVVEPLVLKEEPLDENENNEMNSSKVKIGIDLLEILIKTTITCAKFEDLIVQSVANLRTEGSYSVIITRNNHVYFPNVPEQNPNLAEESLDEELKCSIESSELNVVLNPFRIVISGTTLKASLQVCGVEKVAVKNIIQFNDVWKVSEEILPLLNILSSNGAYNVCVGYSSEELLLETNNYVKPLSLITRESPFLRYESPKCTYVSPSQLIRNRCSACLKWLQQMKRNYIVRVTKSDMRQLPNTDVSSKIAFAHLSPQELKIRLSEIQKEKKNLKKRVLELENKLTKAETKLNAIEGKVVFNDNIANDDNEILGIDEPIMDGIGYQITKPWVDDNDLLNEPIPDDHEDINEPFLDHLNNSTNDDEKFPNEFKSMKRKKTLDD